MNYETPYYIGVQNAFKFWKLNLYIVGIFIFQYLLQTKLLKIVKFNKNTMDFTVKLRSLRRSIAAFAVIALMSTLLPFASIAAAGDLFDDVDNDHWVAQGFLEDGTEVFPLQTIVDAGIVMGRDGETNFGMRDTFAVVTGVTMVVRSAFGEPTLTDDEVADAVAQFDMADDIPSWAAPYMADALLAGVVDADVNPRSTVTREMYAEWQMLALGLVADEATGEMYSDVAVGHPMAGAIGAARNAGTFCGLGGTDMFGLGDDFTKPQAVIAEFYAGFETRECGELTGPPVSYGGPLSLRNMSVESLISGNVVPPGSTSVEMLAVELTAGNEAVLVNGATVERFGVGATSDVDKVAVFRDEARLTNPKGLSSDTNTADFSFTAFELAPRESTVLSFRANFDAGAGAANQHALSLVAVDSDASSVGTLPVDGDFFVLTTQAAGTATLTQNGTISDSKLGETGVKLAQFRMEVDGEASDLEHLTLKFGGTVSNDGIANLELRQGSDVYAYADSLTAKDLAVFDLLNGPMGPFVFDDGDSRIFTVYGDITSFADIGETVNVYVDKTIDVRVRGHVYGTGLTVCTATAGTCTGTYNNTDGLSSSTLEGGEVTFSLVNTGSLDHPIDFDEAILLEFNLVSQANVDIERLDIGINGTDLVDPSSVAYYNSFKIINLDTGGIFMSSQELSTSGGTFDTAQTLTFDDTKYVPAGEEMHLAVVCDIVNDAAIDGDTISADLDAIGDTFVLNVDTGDYIVAADDIVPSGGFTGLTHDVVASSLTVSLANINNTTTTIVGGMVDYAHETFRFEAGSSRAVLLTDLTLTGHMDSDIADGTYTAGVDATEVLSDIVYNVRLFDGVTPVGNSRNVDSTTGDVTFDGLDYEIPANGVSELTVVVDTRTSAPLGAEDDSFFFDIDAVGDVVATDLVGNSVTPTLSGADHDGTTLNTDVTDAGSILVDAVDNNVPAAIHVAGGDEFLASEFKLTADVEAFKVDELSFALVSGDYTGIQAATLTYPGPNGETLTKTETLGGSGPINFDGIVDFTVPDDNDGVTIGVSISTDEHVRDSGAIASDTPVAVIWDESAAAFEFQGADSTTTVDAAAELGGGAGGNGDVDVAAGIETHYIFKAVPIITVVNPTSGGTLEEGSPKPTFGFTITADGGAIQWSEMAFDVTTSNLLATGSGFTRGKLWDMTSGQVLVNSAVDGNATSIDGAFDDDDGWETGGPGSGAESHYFNLESSTLGVASIAANTTRTYKVENDVIDDGNAAGGHTVSTSIFQDTTYAAQAAAIDVAGSAAKPTIVAAEANCDGVDDDGDTVDDDGFGVGGDKCSVAGFVWSDRGDASHTTATTDWSNGFEVDGLTGADLSLSN